jgi:hypothetical protein
MIHLPETLVRLRAAAYRHCHDRGVPQPPGHAGRADNVDLLIRDLKSGSDYKIRLSAALSSPSWAKRDRRSSSPSATRTRPCAPPPPVAEPADRRRTPDKQRAGVQAALERLLAKGPATRSEPGSEVAVHHQSIAGPTTASSGGNSVFIDIGSMSSRPKSPGLPSSRP